MKIVQENLNFERGLESKKAINIGKSKLDKDIIENTNWVIDLDKHGFHYEIIDLIRDYRGYPILILKHKQADYRGYIGISRRGVFGETRATAKADLKDVKRVVDADITLIG